jgi:hypothetical protein
MAHEVGFVDKRRHSCGDRVAETATRDHCAASIMALESRFHK